jgi:hypothetical protein
VFEPKHFPKTTAVTAQALNSFPHRKTKQSNVSVCHATCTVLHLFTFDFVVLAMAGEKQK